MDVTFVKKDVSVKTTAEEKSITGLFQKKWSTFRTAANVHPFLPNKWTPEK